jgi:hypothetical protein
MTTPDSVKSTSPDAFLRRRNMMGADASTEPTGNMPVKSVGDLDTLYQTKESTTITPDPIDPREPAHSDSDQAHPKKQKPLL